MIKKRYILIPLFVIVIGVLVIGALGYILFLRNANETEVVFAATEVGTPVGDKVTKDIGPAGGTLASPDGRLTLTVPPNALSETLPFSIQPITNKAESGIGIAYRLEPNGKTFTTPLQVSVHYDDHDLEGTFAEALTLAYQDGKGSWRAQKSTQFDEAAKTVTVSTNHFTDWSFLTRLRILPPEATVHIREDKYIHLVQCAEGQSVIDWILNRSYCSDAPVGKETWKLRGPGKLERNYVYGVTYVAPDKKPTPNVAFVDLTIEFELWGAPGTFTKHKESRTFSSKITIVGGGYKVSGSDGPNVYSGTVCDLERQFTITMTNGPLTITNKFFPSSAKAGAATGSGDYYGGHWVVSGNYEIKDSETELPEIEWLVGTVLSGRPGTTGGSGMAHIHLTQDNSVECN